MMHTGDEYEARARAARHAELRALVRVLSGFLFRPQPSRNSGRPPHLGRTACANDRAPKKDRAA
ncbi:hypothetical protein [Roseibium marinum]|uniref:Uncharacterized protein n=1 Tax=Roseibium marinum TaxID=281252 RepID=A0A2S3UM87_9HYPH|nr:hypothetical protein [Roseibium marinum]POF28838.1 hypothetical protein CLV41_11188 [Roseibium marinum]